MADGESGPSILLRADGEPRDASPRPLLRVASKQLQHEPLLLGGSSTTLPRLPAVWRRLRSMLSRSCRDSRLPYITSSSDIGWPRTTCWARVKRTDDPLWLAPRGGQIAGVAGIYVLFFYEGLVWSAITTGRNKAGIVVGAGVIESDGC